MSSAASAADWSGSEQHSLRLKRCEVLYILYVGWANKNRFTSHECDVQKTYKIIVYVSRITLSIFDLYINIVEYYKNKKGKTASMLFIPTNSEMLQKQTPVNYCVHHLNISK